VRVLVAGSRVLVLDVSWELLRLRQRPHHGTTSWEDTTTKRTSASKRRTISS
jgi:hypothetical protein